VQVRLAEDGEVLIRGCNIMKGYWNNPDATAEVIDEQGWLHSGDIGQIDADGMLTITNRKKDIIVTAGGKNIAPQSIEALLEQSPWIAHGVVVGESRNHLTALITLNHAALAQWAVERSRPSEPQALAQDPEVHAMIQLDIDRVNHRLARFESVKGFAILPDEFSIDGGELTPTGRVKRAVVEKRYATTIDRLYAKTDTPTPYLEEWI
jgi:long-chain acyl-CoA synthetase